MPIYEYTCTECKHEFEEIQGFSDEPLRKCPECGKNTLEKNFLNRFGLNFKGKGFHCNDYGDNTT